MITILDKINGWHPVILGIIALGIGMTDINEYLKGGVYIITISYMAWKWYNEYHKSKNDGRSNKKEKLAGE